MNQMRRMQRFLAGPGLALLGLVFAGTAAAQGAPKPAAPPSSDPGPSPRDFDGVWWTPGYDRKFRTVEGELPPFTERGRKEWEHNVKADEAGKPVADAPTGCLPHGIPRLLASPYPIQIITTPGQMTWVHEVNRNQRWIYMDETHPANLPKTYLGHSVGALGRRHARHRHRRAERQDAHRRGRHHALGSAARGGAHPQGRRRRRSSRASSRSPTR